MLGEAKCLRAMVYHDLVVMFGDVPFTFLPASQLGDNYVIPVMNREEIQNKPVSYTHLVAVLAMPNFSVLILAIRKIWICIILCLLMTGRMR